MARASITITGQLTGWSDWIFFFFLQATNSPSCRHQQQPASYSSRQRRGGSGGWPHRVKPLAVPTIKTTTYEVYKLSNEAGNVAPDLATLRRREGWKSAANKRYKVAKLTFQVTPQKHISCYISGTKSVIEFVQKSDCSTTLALHFGWDKSQCRERHILKHETVGYDRDLCETKFRDLSEAMMQGFGELRGGRETLCCALPILKR
ncbi:hypothetical protein NQ318_011024 [Aromia moschata]|uniref:Uncharacterized protein n=1 Tax=Aromia moschata TaxID=1265417 RepID=A0AAV8YSH1_9CUCU|nr:hypothetical protein NQ318_011024 [Aromia moschata]